MNKKIIILSFLTISLFSCQKTVSSIISLSPTTTTKYNSLPPIFSNTSTSSISTKEYSSLPPSDVGMNNEKWKKIILFDNQTNFSFKLIGPERTNGVYNLSNIIEFKIKVDGKKISNTMNLYNYDSLAVSEEHILDFSGETFFRYIKNGNTWIKQEEKQTSFEQEINDIYTYYLSLFTHLYDDLDSFSYNVDNDSYEAQNINYSLFNGQSKFYDSSYLIKIKNEQIYYLESSYYYEENLPEAYQYNANLFDISTTIIELPSI